MTTIEASRSRRSFAVDLAIASILASLFIVPSGAQEPSTPKTRYCSPDPAARP